MFAVTHGGVEIDDVVFVLRDGFMSPPPPADAPPSGTPMAAPAFPGIWPRPAA